MTNRSFSITVNKIASPVWSTSPNLGVMYGNTAISIPLHATDPLGLPVTYAADPNNALNGYSLPASLTLYTNGVISGTLVNPISTGTFSFTVEASNGVANSTAQTFTGTVVDVQLPIWITQNGSLANVIALSTCATVSLELNGDTPNGSTTILDNQGHTISTFGNVAISNVTSIFGNSIVFGGGGLIATPNANEFDFANNDFTIELSVKFSAFSPDNRNQLLEQWSFNNLGWSLAFIYDTVNLVGGLEFSWSEDGNTAQTVGMDISAWMPTLDTWYRLAIVGNQASGTLLFYVNGVAMFSSTGLTPIFASTAPIVAGFDVPSSSGLFSGYMDEVRITMGLARYTGSNYTQSLYPFISPAVTPLQVVAELDLPVTYVVSSGSLPAGVTLNANTGYFGGFFNNVNAVTTYNFDVTASSFGGNAVAAFSMTLTPDNPPFWLSTADLGTVMGGYFFSNTLHALPTTFPLVTYTVANGTTLPVGLSLNAVTGIVSGYPANPVANTTATFVVGATDGFLTNTLSAQIEIVYNQPPVLNISPNAVVGTWFGNVVNTATITATDPNGLGQSITFAGSLPAGLSISNSGVITGTIAQPATLISNVAARVTATNGVSSNTVQFFIGEHQTQEPVWITNSGVLANIVELYAMTPVTLSAVDLNAFPVSYYIANGTLPGGLTLNATSGVISGTPVETMTATYASVVFGASNGIVANTLSAAFNITPNKPPVWNITSLPTGYSNGVYDYALVATDPTGLNQSITYTLVSGTLPMGLTFYSNGVISGTFGEVDNTVTENLSVQASDLGGNAVQNLNLTVASYLGPQWTIPGGDLGGVIGLQAVSLAVGATDPEGFALTYSISNGSLPPGLTLSNGVISGTSANPAANTSYTFDITVADVVSNAVETFSIDVYQNLPPIFTSNNISVVLYGGTTVPNTVAAAYDINYQSITYYVDNGTSLPTGISLDPFSAMVTGIATNPGSNTVTDFVISAYNGYLFSYQTGSIEVDQTLGPIFSATGSIGYYLSNTTISNSIVATDPQGFPITYTLNSGSLPSGITLLANGVFSGNTTTVSNSISENFVVQATNNIVSTLGTFSVTVVVPPTWISNVFPNVYEFQTISHPLVATDHNNTAVTYSLIGGTLPSGLTLYANGVVNGVVSNAATIGVNSFTVLAADLYTNAAQTFACNVITYVAPVWVTPAGLLDSGIGTVSISNTVMATSADGFPLSYSIASGSLPASMALSSSGVITGNLPNLSGSFTFGIAVADGISSVSQSFSVAVTAVIPVWISSSVPAVTGGSAYTTTLVATGSPTYAIVSGSLPVGLSLNSSTGAISGTPANFAATPSVTIAATNTAGSVNQTFTFTVTPSASNYDPYSQYVVLQMPFTGTIGANTPAALWDNIGHSVQVHYNANTPILTTPLSYNGLNERIGVFVDTNAYMTIPVGEEFVFGNNDYTIEWSCFGTNNTPYFGFDTGFNMNYYNWINGANISIASVTWQHINLPSIGNAWIDYALVKQGGTITFYICGEIVLTNTPSAVNGASIATPHYVIIGNQNASGNSGASCCMSNLRITNGAARYTSNYVVPTSFPTLPNFVQPANTMVGPVTTGVSATLSIPANDPVGLGLTYAVDGIPTGMSLNSSTGVITGVPTGYTSDTLLILNVMIQDGNNNRQMRAFLLAVLATPSFDAHGGQTVFLLHCVGTPASNAVSEVFGHPFTTYGVPVLADAPSLFAGSSLYFNGSSGFIFAPVDTEFCFGINDFTIEVSAQFNATGTQYLIQSSQANYLDNWSFYYDGSNHLFFSWNIGHANPQYLGCSWTPTTNHWHQLAVVCQSNTIMIFADGVQLSGTATISASAAMTGGWGTLFVGYQGFNNYNNNFFSGYMDEIRITNGYARYTGSTYAVPTASFANPIKWTQSVQATALNGQSGNPVSWNLTPTEPYGASMSGISVSGLPSGLSAAGAVISGTLPSVSIDTSYAITVSASSAFSTAQKTFVVNNRVASAGTDPYANVVTLFMDFAGMSGNTTNILFNPALQDLTGLNTIRQFGAPVIGNTVTTSPALFLDGNSGLIANAASIGNFSFGSNDFTIEFRVNFNSLSNAPFLIASWTQTYLAWTILLRGSSLAFDYTTNGNYGSDTEITGSWSPSTGIWYHVAVVRQNTNLYMFINGTQVGTTQTITAPIWSTMSTGNQIASSIPTVQIGYSHADNNYYFNGYMDNIRITNGHARYTSNYTPPTSLPVPISWSVPSLAPSPTRGAVTLLMNFNSGIADDTGQSTISNYGSPIWTNGVTSGGSGAMFLNGSSGVVLSGASSLYSFGANDFTIECSVYFTVTPTNSPVFISCGSSNNYDSSAQLLYVTGNLQFAYSTNGASVSVINNAWTPLNNTWYKLAMVRYGGAVIMFVNGSQIGTTQSMNNTGSLYTVSNGNIGYCRMNGIGQFMNGYMDGIRITSGTALYTSNYTPAPMLTSIVTPSQTTNLTFIKSGTPL